MRFIYHRTKPDFTSLGKICRTDPTLFPKNGYFYILRGRLPNLSGPMVLVQGVFVSKSVLSTQRL